jgi:hypothetical protein
METTLADSARPVVIVLTGSGTRQSTAEIRWNDCDHGMGRLIRWAESGGDLGSDRRVSGVGTITQFDHSNLRSRYAEVKDFDASHFLRPRSTPPGSVRAARNGGS